MQFSKGRISFAYECVSLCLYCSLMGVSSNTITFQQMICSVATHIQSAYGHYTSKIVGRKADNKWLLPVVEVLSNDQMFEVIINGSLIVLQQCVGVTQTVTGLGLHCSVLQKPSQLQSPPEGKTEEEEES